MSIDEISMRKGKGSLVTVVSDIEDGNLIKMIECHRQQDIVKILSQQPFEGREPVEEVSVDMWGKFPKVIEKLFQNAQVVINRFHVMKAVNQDLNKLRRAIGITDRGSKYLLLSNRRNLKLEQNHRWELTLKIRVFKNCLGDERRVSRNIRNLYNRQNSAGKV